MLKSRMQSVFIMIIFLAMLTLPLLYADWEGGAYSEGEKRILAKAPWAREDPTMDQRAATETWMNDNAGFRALAMKARVQLEYSLFRHSAIPIYLIGQEDWIYYAPKEVISDYVGENLMPQFLLDEWNKNLKLLNQLVEDNGAKLLMTIVPDKKTMYPEYYSPYLRHEIENTRTKQLAGNIRLDIQGSMVILSVTLSIKKR